MTDAVDVLAIGAHPDDVELAVGGTILAMLKRGHSVAIVDCTRGELGTRGSADVRAVEAQEAARRLGVTQRVNLHLPDGGVFDDQPGRQALVRVIREFRPTIVLGPREDDLHPDHARASRLVREAAFLAGVKKWDAGLPPHRPRAVLQYLEHTQATPSFVVDISEQLAAKKHAAMAYASQFHNAASTEPATYISSSRFWDWWEGHARHYGNLIGAAHGEPFVVSGPLRVEDPVALFRDFGYYPK